MMQAISPGNRLAAVHKARLAQLVLTAHLAPLVRIPLCPVRKAQPAPMAHLAHPASTALLVHKARLALPLSLLMLATPAPSALMG